MPSVKSSVNHASPALKAVKPALAANETETKSGTTKTTSSSNFLDLKQALVPQMFSKRFTKRFYLDEVHKPKFIKGSALFFNQPYLEIFTRTPWYVVPLFWGPIVIWHLVEAIKQFSGTSQSAFACAALVAIGVFAWTLLEYTFHRFLFHIEKALPSYQFAYAIHFLLHGVHHFLPMDRMRLVMPPILFAFLFAVLI